MSPVPLVLIVPLVWECSFHWRGFLIHTFLIPAEVLVLSRLRKRKIQTWAAPKKGEVSSPPPPWWAAAVWNKRALMGRFCSGKETLKTFKLTPCLAFCWIPPFGSGFWLQGLQAMEQSINKLYKSRKASQGNLCCLLTDCCKFGGLF